MELKEKELSNDLNPNSVFIRKQARKSLVQLAGEIIHLKYRSPKSIHYHYVCNRNYLNNFFYNCKIAATQETK